MKLRIPAGVASLVGVLALAAPALAAPHTAAGGSAKSSAISLVLVSPAGAASSADAAGGPRFGDQVTFDIATTETASPYVGLKCFQSGATVGEAWEGFFDGALGDRTFTLASPLWTSGAADCTASLGSYVNGRWKTLAATSFHVDG
jgi:hypothetical protein